MTPSPRQSGGRSAAPGLPQKVLGVLADGDCHAGSALAAKFSVSRSAIWKATGVLRALGVDLESQPRRGYRWRQPTPLLSRTAILAALPPALRQHLRHGEACWSTGSTNTDLLRLAAPPPGRWDFALAEYQTAGRGRRARPWLAPPGGGLCLSLGWSYASLPSDAPALSLAIGVCVVEALARFAPLPLALKWPNDLLADGRKLGGILLELKAEAAGAAHVVVGLGLNIALPKSLQRRVAATGTEVADLAGLGLRVDRSLLAAALIDSLCEGLARFGREGFAPFLPRWRALDALAGKPVRISDGEQHWSGHARGIDAAGALCVHMAGGLRRVTAGDVSVRPE